MTIEKHIDERLARILETVPDPEIPVLSIMELGVVRSAKITGDKVEVDITPTYSGCPAMDVIGDDIKKALKSAGYESKINLVLSPAWSTDWITPKGRLALEKYGIASPLEQEADKEALLGNKKLVKCPQCGSLNTKMVSQFGSTACKAFFQCEDCLEPFDYFKCLNNLQFDMSSIILKIEDNIGFITLNRPEVFNSFNREMALQLQQILDQCAQDENIRAIVITGSGKAFCAGQDLKEVTTPDLMPGFRKILEEHYNPIIERIRHIEKPVIAAVNGRGGRRGGKYCAGMRYCCRGGECVVYPGFF